MLEGGKWDGRVYLIDFGGVQGAANAGEQRGYIHQDLWLWLQPGSIVNCIWLLLTAIQWRLCVAMGSSSPLASPACLPVHVPAVPHCLLYVLRLPLQRSSA